MLLGNFTKTIGGSEQETRDLRVKNCVDSVCEESKSQIMLERKEYRAEQNALLNLFDLGPTSTTDIATNVKNINPENLIKDIRAHVDELFIKARKLQLHIKVHNIMFPDSPENPLTSEELDFIGDVTADLITE